MKTTLDAFQNAGLNELLFNPILSQGVKAQIISPEDEDEEGDGYAFNEVCCCCCCFFFLFTFPQIT